jgi:hypothetical protein
MGAQPAFTGGAIASGSYNVTTVEIYPPDGGKNICGFIGDVSVKGAATVSGSELQLVLVVGPPANDTIGFDGTYVENGHSLVVTPTCGASSTSTQTLQYTATASTLVIDAQIMGYTGLITLALAP